MTSAQIRQSFLDFFAEKKHTIVPSSSLMPDSPNLLFTNAGMNQFVPIFLGERKADVDSWSGAIKGSKTRAADTQKCIRAGGKHNDLDDVGLDTYHHTFFEMLGNWSFGDYFKREAIEWAWELVVGRWKFPANRLYATVYCPDQCRSEWKQYLDCCLELAEKGITQYHAPTLPPGNHTQRGLEDSIDGEAIFFWALLFHQAKLDARVHILPGNKKDNFWMMGDTGPCGPCSELHVDLTPEDRTLEMEKRGASLVNKGDARCIEIWNLVFIQFNANPDGTFSPLPAQHVDTGMGFERVTSIIQGTKNFTDFANAKISNYETDIFRPIFDEIEKLSGKKYASTLPKSGSAGESEQEKIDVAFRVIADHIRTLSFAIVDGIQPGNTDRNYVLRRILRRAVRYGRTLGFHEPFFYKLTDVLARTMGDVFPEIRAKQAQVKDVLKREEEAFNKTLDNGIELFEDRLAFVISDQIAGSDVVRVGQKSIVCIGNIGDESLVTIHLDNNLSQRLREFNIEAPNVPGAAAFLLYDTYGFPLDLTELMARECGLTVDVAGFEKLMDEQRARARAAQKKEVISVSDDNLQVEPTQFLGYDFLETEAVVEAVTPGKNEGELNVVLDRTACYAEMGGQVGDHGLLHVPGHDRTESGRLAVLDTQKRGDVFIHRAKLTGGRAPEPGEAVRVAVDAGRRAAIQRHHTVTHLLHWALHEVVSRDASQKGSFVGADKLTFDFNSAALTPDQVAHVEKLVNEKIVENAGVSWTEVPYAEVKKHPAIMQFFGDKYGDLVRVVQIGGKPRAFDGYSMELCGGTHTRATGEIGLFRIVAESAIAAGVRRIEAVAGLSAYDFAHADSERLKTLASKLGSPLADLEKRIDSMLAQQKEMEKALKAAQQRDAAGRAKDLLASAETINGTPAIIANLGNADGDTLQTVADALKSAFKGVVVLGGASSGAVALVASVSSDFTAKAQAGKIIQTIAPIVGGKGSGKPDNARGGGKDASKLDEALAKAKSLLAT